MIIYDRHADDNIFPEKNSLEVKSDDGNIVKKMEQEIHPPLCVSTKTESVSQSEREWMQHCDPVWVQCWNGGGHHSNKGRLRKNKPEEDAER